MRQTFLITLIISYISYSVKCGLMTGKKPKVELEDVGKCAEPVFQNLPMSMFVSATKYNDSIQLISGNVTVAEPWGKQFTMYIEFRRKVNGVWKTDFKLKKDNGCLYLVTFFGPIATKLMKEVGISGCPIPPGVYAVKDIVFDMYSFPFAYTTGEFWLYSLHYKKPKNEITFCSSGLMTISV